MATTNPAGGGGRLSAEARRAQILESALPVFARRGYAGTGTRELARAAGVSEPILYRHFEDKAGLFRAVLEQVEARVAAELDAAAAAERGAAARLKALGASLPAILDRCRDDLRVLNAAALAHEDPEILDAAGRCARGIGLALAQLFRGSGLRRGMTARAAGFLLLELGLGASVLSPLALPEIEGAAFRDRAVKVLLAGIAD